MLSDIRLAFRTLSRAPGFSIAAVLTLALGIGAGAAIYSVIHAVLLKPLPFADPERLVSVVDIRGDVPVPTGRSEASYDVWRQRSTRLAGLALYRETEFTVTGHGEPELAKVLAVSEDFFDTLGTPPRRGRLPRTDEATHPLAVLSHSFTRRRFPVGEPIGSTLLLDGRPYTVIGVMPEAFAYPSHEIAAWIPRLSLADEKAGYKYGRYDMIGRLRPGVTVDQARAEAVAVRREARGPAAPQPDRGRTEIRLLEEEIVGDVRHGLLVLLGIVGLLLLIAAINVGGLCLSRVETRRSELAVRSALGAGRWHLVRHQLAEALVLVGGAAALAVPFAAALLSAITRVLPPDTPRLAEVTVSLAVLAFVLAASALTVVIVLLAPARQASLAPAVTASGGWLATRGPQQRGRTRSVLLAAQTALSVLVVAAALLFGRSLAQLLSVESGRPDKQVLTLGVQLPPPAYADCLKRPDCTQAAVRFASQVRERARAIPGVTAAGLTTSLPPHRSLMSFTGAMKNLETGRPEQYLFNIVVVDPGYFDTLGIRLVHGRGFDTRDGASSPAVVLVSRDLARRQFGKENAVGETLPIPPRPATIVGVVDDVRYGGLDRPAGGAIYLLFAQAVNPQFSLVVRTTGSIPEAAARVKAVVQSLDPRVPLSRPLTLNQLRHASVAEPEARAILTGCLALLALLLAGVGIYANSAYAVARRAFEVGLRMALGASGGSVIRLLAVEGLGPVAAGLAAGLAGAAALSRFVSRLLFNVRPLDPVAFGGVCLLLLAVAAAAVSLPAARAVHVDPASTLRRTA